MNSLARAIWYIESHYAADITLDDVAQAAGLSKFHLVRAFGIYAGRSVMRHVRARRLSESARRIASDNRAIVDIALDAGYGSHEAFTRAFGEQFGLSPNQLRKTRCLDNLELVEPLKMDQQLTTLAEPRITDSEALLVVGLRKRYSDDTSARIPDQWQDFAPYIGHIPHQQGNIALGVLCNGDDDGNIDYLTGVEVSRFADSGSPLDSLRIAPRTYAVFRHDGHVSEIRRSWKTIFGRWLPEADYQLVDAPQLERYGEGFDPRTGEGDIEIWIPVSR